MHVTDPLVFLPDMICDARVFEEQITVISRDRSVMIVPYHHHDTIAEAAKAILPTLPARFALAGAGLGSALAMEVLRGAADRVSRIALISAQSQAEGAAEAAQLEQHIVQAKAGRFNDAVFGAMRLDRLAAGIQRVDVQDKVVQMAQAFGVHGFVKQLKMLQKRPDQQRTLRTARLPAAVICGAEDAKYTLRHHQILADLMPEAKLVHIEGAAHLPSLEAPSLLTAALQDWLGAPLLLG